MSSFGKQIRIEVDASDVKRSLASMALGMDAFINNTDEANAKAVEVEAKRIAPVRTGKLKAAIKSGQNKSFAYVTSRKGYSNFVIFGTKHMKGNDFLMKAVKNASSSNVVRAQRNLTAYVKALFK